MFQFLMFTALGYSLGTLIDRGHNIFLLQIFSTVSEVHTTSDSVCRRHFLYAARP